MSRLVIALETLALTCVLVASAGAQPATTSFDQLRYVVKVGQKITVRDTTGASLRGRVLSVTDSYLTLNVKGQRRDLTEQDVVRIHTRRRHGSLKSSAIVGAIPPAVIAAGFASSEGKGVAVVAGAIWGGMGAALASGVHALDRRRDLLYERVPRVR
jgi:hypothetical protein